jgi:anti-sigma regulatory factor (Ser/Thr protein kinase)
MEVTQQFASQFVVEVSDSSHAGEARRAVVRSAEQIGMNESDRGSVAIAATELATNLIKHARGGKLVCESLGQNGTRGVRILSIDSGSGIQDIAKALEDGYSTSGTLGNGLGAVRRLASRFDLYSVPGGGTCLVADFWPKKKVAADEANLQLGVISLPLQGEALCGDGWLVKRTMDETLILVVDGLGHGSSAAEAAREAERVFAETDSISPAIILHDCHHALRKTRGAAAAIAVVNREKGTLVFAGMGNISATLFKGPSRRGIASHNGTLGHHLHKIQEFALPWDEESLLIMHSDGLSTRWDLEHYPGVRNKHAALVASVLYRDYARGRDDVTVLAAKNCL